MLIQVKDLQKKFKDYSAVKGITFQVNKGRCIGLLGPNGAGKTTTLQMLAGLLTPTKGEIIYSGTKDCRRYIGFLPQHPAFFRWMTPIEFLQFVGKLSDIPKNHLKQRITEVLQFVHLTDVRNKKIGGFSGGMKQRLGLAQALLHEPELLILDEPVSALDPEGRRDVLTIIEKLKESMTILFSTHVLHDAEQVCDDIIMLKQGEIKWAGPLSHLKHEFSSSIIKIDTAEPLVNAWDGFIHPDHVQCIDSNKAIFSEENLQVPANTLLMELIKKGYTIQRFEKIQDSLEDAYMKVMDQ